MLKALLAGFALGVADDVDFLREDACEEGSEQCHLSLRQLRGQRSQADIHLHSGLASFPLEKDTAVQQDWPMTDAASGFCAFPSQRSDPTLGAPSQGLGASPLSREEVRQVCQMARKYPGHSSEPGTECATPAACPGCNGVWCNATVESLMQMKESIANETEVKEVYPLSEDNETEKTWPMTDAASGFCAYPSERSDPELGAKSLGSAPKSPEEIAKVCQMALQYQGHRANPGTECATPDTCGGCNGVWCNATLEA